jgi:hypothetical protein
LRSRSDFGSETQERLNNNASENFGVKETLPNSSKLAVTQAQALANPKSLITLAKGLSARVVTISSGVNTDQIAFWPNDTQPTHLIVCNEQEEAEPGLQRINLQTGATDTIVTGTVECDPVRRTAWGTIIFGEEDGTDGHLYELIDPLHTTGVAWTGRPDLHGTTRQNLVRRDRRRLVRRLRPAAERRFYTARRPSSGKNGDTTSCADDAVHRHQRDHVPVAVAVRERRFRAQDRSSGGTPWGQEQHRPGLIGAGCDDRRRCRLRARTSISVGSRTARLTGYYRPECTTTGCVAGRQCGSAATTQKGPTTTSARPSAHGRHGRESLAGTAVPNCSSSSSHTAARDGQPRLPVNRGNVVERGWRSADRNNDIWSCLPDGTDDDLLSDGCGRIMSLNDPTAETTGGIFNGNGSKYYVSIQHNISGKGLVLEITGWR